MANATSSGSVDISEWSDLIGFEPSQALTTELRRRRYEPRPIATAEPGVVNLDHFAVRVTELPTVQGRRPTPEQLLSYIRENLNSFVDGALAEFHPGDDTVDGPRWRSSRPRGALVTVDLKTWKLAQRAPLVCSRSASDHWRFTTLGLADSAGAWRTGGTVSVGQRVRSIGRKTQTFMHFEGSHPISGTREFGVRRCQHGDVEVYTRAADCLTDFGWGVLDRSASLLSRNASIVYALGERVWSSFQLRTAEFVLENRGNADVLPPRVVRAPYGAISGFLKPAHA